MIMTVLVLQIRRWLTAAFGLGMMLACTAVRPLAQNQPQVTPTNMTKPIAGYLALGDSYTIGESVQPNERWSVQLAEMLKQDKIDLGITQIIARTGWTTAELQDGIAASGLSGNYELVSLLIGVNNQYRRLPLEQYRTEFGALLEVAIKFAKGNPKRVFVLSIPDWGVSPFAAGQDRQQIAKAIDSFNEVAQAACAKAGVLYIDITPLSRQAANQPSYIATDQLHFSGIMYGLWAKEALPAVKKLF